MEQEDKEWVSAKEFFDRVLSMDAENYDAYLGMVLANARLTNLAAFRAAYINMNIAETPDIKRARRFADVEQKTWWASWTLK